ncbi:cupin domain-containing protein [Neobacillus drentensis]|uniref:cupin domain-containing protein n=1 Tax=Neobacillus drentensis TaxID=220684 RepID=UPI001F4324A4|nr:cupin domain-containing protein [Neobacillus drentensis]
MYHFMQGKYIGDGLTELNSSFELAQIKGKGMIAVMNMNEVHNWVSKVGLARHPEGGYYKSTFESDEQITDKELSVNFEGQRRLFNSIFFLLTSEYVSHFHLLKYEISLQATSRLSSINGRIEN